MKRTSAALVAMTLLTPGIAVAATRVASDSSCPSADAVSQRLLGLVASGGPTTASARVRGEGDNLRIELSFPGEADQERTVAAGGDCEARAETAALVIASWLDAMPVGTISAPGIPPRAPPPAPAPSAEAEPLDDEEEPRLPVSTHALVGAGLFGLADSDGASAGLVLVGGMPRLLGVLGWLAEASLGLPREVGVGPQGTARYWRPTFGLAATVEMAVRSWRFRPQAGPALGVLSVRGSDYQPNNRATTVTWGASAGLAMARSWRRGEIWLRLDGLAWPQGRILRSKQLPSGPDFETALPEMEARLAAGMSFGIQ